ncbi:hypothetical protein J2Z69_003243 [Paenibacillus shirakamiensis]|uniref:Glycogen biosynthesis protein GlgD n=1 Tax=Paenibacillus shirakamiensis TaxID=1265935 RepID=A0ABS4JM56_9BACL|nr:hypothetical protein [Paenibacillus shirakamiensis]MBP2002186.1 hypothetical protein [Paenibacillus shirakamiensis]
MPKNNQEGQKVQDNYKTPNEKYNAEFAEESQPTQGGRKSNASTNNQSK